MDVISKYNLVVGNCYKYRFNNELYYFKLIKIEANQWVCLPIKWFINGIEYPYNRDYFRFEFIGNQICELTDVEKAKLL